MEKSLSNKGRSDFGTYMELNLANIDIFALDLKMKYDYKMPAFF
jgi:hypothetical protein